MVYAPSIITRITTPVYNFNIISKVYAPSIKGLIWGLFVFVGQMLQATEKKFVSLHSFFYLCILNY